MKMVHKYEVEDFRQTYPIPLNSDFLSVGKDYKKGNIALYFAVDPAEKKTETRSFWLVSVGRTIPNDSKYYGTIAQDGMNYHLFELLNRHLRKVIN